MYTHCPHCDTYFRVTSAQLKGANGNVRCGRCFGTFNALQNLIDEPPSSNDRPATPTLADDKEAILFDEKETGETAPADKSGSENDLKRQHSQALLSEIQTGPEKSPSGKPLLWGLLSIPLAVLALAQYALLDLDRLAQNPGYRPGLAQLCSLAGCELPLLKAPQQIKLLEREIRSHPDTKEILLVKAIIQNEAADAQAFPLIELTLQDITGHILSGRRFLPDEYLVDPSLDPRRGLLPKQPVTIVLELVDPGKEAVGFEFDFR